MYFVLLCIHLLSAVCFVGYVFFDACIYPLAYKSVDRQECDEVKRAYSKRGAMIFGLLFGVLLFSGVGLLSYYDIASVFSLKSAFSLFFVIKMALLLLMFVLTAYSIFVIYALKKADPFKKKSHIIALAMCVGIIICAKAMQSFSF